MGESRGERSGCYRASSIDSGEREPGAFNHHTIYSVDHSGCFCHRDSGTEGNADSSCFRGRFCLGDGGADFEFDAPFMCGK